MDKAIKKLLQGDFSENTINTVKTLVELDQVKTKRLRAILVILEIGRAYLNAYRDNVEKSSLDDIIKEGYIENINNIKANLGEVLNLIESRILKKDLER